MGKRIIQRARGKGSLTYRTRKKAFRIHVSYPTEAGMGEVLKLINVPCYSAPVAKIKINGKIFYNIAANNLYEGQKIPVNAGAAAPGSILELKDIPIGTNIFCIETEFGSGPKLVRSSGISAKVLKKEPRGIYVLMPSKKEKCFNPKIRATVGLIAAGGRTEKPILKAGKAFYMAKAIGGRIYPQTSAVKMNAVDHPFGSGRGKRIKSKIVKRWASPGTKVGLLRPKRTGGKRHG